MGICFFSDVEAKITTLSGLGDGVAIKSNEFGEYFISNEALRAYSDSGELTKKQKLVCLQESIKISNEGMIPYWIVYDKEEYFNNPNIVYRTISEVMNRDIDHINKDKKILSLLASKLTLDINPFNLTFLSKRDRYGIGIFEKNEFEEWVTYLENKGFIELDIQANAIRKTIGDGQRFVNHISTVNSIKLTVTGWEFVRNMNSRWNSKNVFIAMAFTDNERLKVSSEVRDVIKTALDSEGWKALIVDEIDHNDGIMDKVIASIHQSRFVIAELTYQKTGVYYEAGYAKGRGLQVIHIVNKKDLEFCHFDVKHLNLVIWENSEELTEKLINRIKATIV